MSKNFHLKLSRRTRTWILIKYWDHKFRNTAWTVVFRVCPRLSFWVFSFCNRSSPTLITWLASWESWVNSSSKICAVQKQLIERVRNKAFERQSYIVFKKEKINDFVTLIHMFSTMENFINRWNIFLPLVDIN